MIDCNITENFLKEKLRMCKNYNSCDDCAFYYEEGDCDFFSAENPKRAIQIVQDWSNKNPQKTMVEDFKEKHPNAPLEQDGIPKTCPYNLGYVEDMGCPTKADGFKMACALCWNRPLEGK